MKNKFFALFTTFTSLVAFGQPLQDAVKKTENENFDAAAIDFKGLIQREPNKGENYFYFGENFFKRGEIDSANMLYTKGAEVNATNPLNYAGLGKVLLAKGNVNDAKTQFYKAITLGANKNMVLLRKIAEAWLVTDNKNPDEALIHANNAVKLEPKNSENYIVLGDAQLEKNPTDGSGPIKSYKMATTLNPKSTAGILREGKLYQRGRNYQLALDKYREAEAIDANYAPAYREKAELFFLVGQPAKSIENWKKYMELNNSDYARYRFMSALYNNKQFKEASAEYENLKRQNFKNLYMERLAGYSYEEMGDKTDKDAYNKGLLALDKFFEMAGSSFKYIANDYKYRGLLLYHLGKDSLGQIEIEKAIVLDPAIKPEVYGKLGKIAVDAKNYKKVISYYEKKKEGDYKALTIIENFDLGKAYYNYGLGIRKQISEQKDELIKKKKPTDNPEIKAKETETVSIMIHADSAFKRVTQLNPGYILGPIWRGRVNSLLDPDVKSDSTKVFYEKAISIMKPEDKTGSYKSNLIEAYEYLGYYYVSKKDKANSDAIFNQLKEVDPANEKAKNYFNPPKPASAKTVTKPTGKK